MLFNGRCPTKNAPCVAQIVYLNIINSICLPTAVIPILKLNTSISVMQNEFRSSKWLSIVCWTLSGIIIGFNVLIFNTFLNEMKFQSPIIGYVVGGTYLAFIVYLIITPLRPSNHVKTSVEWDTETSVSSA
jgi:hypothetical protein